MAVVVASFHNRRVLWGEGRGAGGEMETNAFRIPEDQTQSN